MIFFGGDYHPDQWPEPVWREDVALMRSAGVNLVTVGAFSWSRLQPAPGSFDFSWLDDVLTLLGEAGIGVCLATPTASPPPWFTREHPDAMPVNRDGVRLTHGSRDTYCVSIARELATRYAGNPAVKLWHVHNEYGTTCFCDRCAAGFRVWLRFRYGDPAALNDAWGTDFWSQRYGSFEEVLPPRTTQYLSSPAHELDYRRFFSDALLEHYLVQRSVLPGLVTTNFVLGDWVPVDHARWARSVDLVAVDDYPASVGDHLGARAFTADLARGWARAAGHADGRWLLMEHMPGAVRDGPSGVTRLLPAGSAASVADAYLERGAVGIMYFQWRAGRSGAEQWHPAMVPLLAELRPLGSALRARTPVTVSAPTALLYDEESLWAWQSPHLPTRLDYAAVARRWHAALDGPVDVLPVSAALDGYALVAVPALHLMSEATHAALRDFASNGGTLVIGFGSGLTDGCLRTTPGALDDLIGARVTRSVPLLPEESLPLAGGGAGRFWIDSLTLDGAAPLLSTTGGEPVVVSHRYGAGRVRYVAADLDMARHAATIFGGPP
jgi:beta-galactosidase